MQSQIVKVGVILYGTTMTPAFGYLLALHISQ